MLRHSLAALLLASPSLAQVPRLVGGEAVPHGLQSLVAVQLSAGTGVPIGGFIERCFGLCATRDGRLFGCGLFVGLVELDPFSGEILSDIPGLHGAYQALSAHPVTGELFGVEEGGGGVFLVTIDPDAPSAASAPNPLGVNITGLSWSRSGTLLYGVTSTDANVYTIDPQTGLATVLAVAAIQDVDPLFGLTTHPVSGELYGVEFPQFASPVRVVSISPIDGSRSAVSTIAGYFLMESLAFTDVSLGLPGCTPTTPNSAGSTATLSAWGSADTRDDRFFLEARGLPASQFAMALASPNAGFGANPGGSQGDLCLGAPFARFVPVRQSGAGGRVVFELDLDQVPLNPTVAVASGETWHFQCWYRDWNPGPTSNFTASTSVLFE